MKRGDFVNLTRSGKFADDVCGRVIAVGSKWTLLATIRPGGYPDGLIAVRVKDVNRVGDLDSFQVDVAERHSDWPPAAPPLNFDSTSGLLNGLAELYPLIGIERERKLDQCMWIGVPVPADPKWTWMHEITPQATWKKRPLAYRTRTITCIVVGDEYLTALASVMPKRPQGFMRRVRKGKRE